MSTMTYSALKINVARDLRDPDGKVFDTNDLGDFINASLAEIGLIAPERFQEDIDLVENQFEYTLRDAEFTEAVPEIEVSRVELWDTTTTPIRPHSLIPPATAAYVNYSDVGWTNREGILELPYTTVAFLGSDVDNYLLRVWGYSPYAPLDEDDDVVPVSNERLWALRAFCKVLSLERMVAERDIFTQWQTRAGNTDVSPASLLSALSNAQMEWRRRSAKIAVLR